MNVNPNFKEFCTNFKIGLMAFDEGDASCYFLLYV